MKIQNLFFSLVLILLVIPACTTTPEKPLETVKVTRGGILASIPSTGTVQPRNRVEIKPPVAGRVDDILVVEGENIKKGQILGWMSSNERAALLDSARAKGEAELKYWEDVYKAAPIIAPLDGFIISRSVEPGQSVLASDAILVMADRLIVKAQVDETDLSRIKLGQSVKIVLDSYPDQKIDGKVEHIAYESKMTNNVNIYDVDIQPISIPSFFRSGMSATVSFIQEERVDALLLPLNAVKKKSNRSYVFIKNKSDKIETSQVATGLENSSHIEVISGLKEGDEVIVPTAKLIKDLLNDQHGPQFPSPFSPQRGR